MTKTQAAKAAKRYQWVEVTLTGGTVLAGYFNRLTARHLNIAAGGYSQNVGLSRIASITPATRSV